MEIYLRIYYYKFYFSEASASFVPDLRVSSEHAFSFDNDLIVI